MRRWRPATPRCTTKRHTRTTRWSPSAAARRVRKRRSVNTPAIRCPRPAPTRRRTEPAGRGPVVVRVRPDRSGADWGHGVKLITAVLRPAAFESVRDALAIFGVRGLTVSTVYGTPE